MTNAIERPGVQIGPRSEFTLFFKVIPGHVEAIQQAIVDLKNSPGYRAGDYDMPIASIHEARFTVFDDGTRLLFATSFDGPWDAYMDDFAHSALAGFDAIFQHTVGYGGLPDVAAVKAFVLGAQVSSTGFALNYPGSVKEIRKALRVNEAFQKVLDDPAAAEAFQSPVLKPLLDEAFD